jgi:small-conductance mechanosensitive channel
MAITFQVSRVEGPTGPLPAPVRDRSLSLRGQPVEAMGANAADFRATEQHAFVQAVHWAYSLHYPLALSPDAVWLTIAQGFAMHVNANAEALRGKFVRRPGQPTITVVRDEFVKGSPTNEWPGVFGDFSEAIAAHIGRQRDLVVCDFSTTGPCERAASELVLMEAMQHYFNYEVLTRCGIPEIALEGTSGDWRAIRQRAQALREYDLGWWADALAPVLDQLVATAEGHIDVPFWETFFKHADASGGPRALGWINTLFPYLRMVNGGLERNEHMTAWREPLPAYDFFRGAPTWALAAGLSQVPFVWKYLGTDLPMQFLAGFVGVAQDEGTLAVRPAIGWAVGDAKPVAASPEDKTDDDFREHGTRAPAN